MEATVNMLKVAFIGDVLFPIPDIKGGAISTLVTGIINENEKHPELDITVFSADCDGLLECHNQYRFTKFHRIGKPDKLIKLKVLFWRMIRKLTGYRVQYKNAFMMMVNRLLRNEQYDVIVYENSALEMMQAKRYKNTKNIMHIHADYINSDMNGINYLCRHCDCVMGVSDFITSKMEEIPALKGKGVTLKNAIDLTGFTPKHRPEDGEGIRTQAFDPSKLEDPSLIIYAPVRVLGNKTIVTNGDQTDTIYEGMDKQLTFEQSLRTREFEPDAPNYTPRISGIMHVENGKYNYAMSILKSNNGNPEACNRYTFAYENPVAGEGHFIHTYMHDGNPLPSFEGEPKLVEINGDIDEFTNMVWTNLNEDNKVSLFVRFIDIATGEYETRIVNKNK